MQLNAQQGKVVEWALGDHPLEQTQDTSLSCHKCGEPNDIGMFARSAFGKGRNDKYCFNCNFWAEKVRLAQKPEEEYRIVRTASGMHYWIGDENVHGGRSARGYSGHKFVIEFADGHTVTTTNLWCQGDIPQHWRDELPANASFKEGM